MFKFKGSHLLEGSTLNGNLFPLMGWGRYVIETETMGNPHQPTPLQKVLEHHPTSGIFHGVR